MTSNQVVSTPNANNTMSAIDRALAAARARKAARVDAGLDAPEAPKPAAKAVPKPAKEVKPVKAKPTDEAREAARLVREAERAKRNEEKAAKLAEAKAAKEAKKSAAAAAKAEALQARAAAKKNSTESAHLRKVERARAKLPKLGEEAQKTFDELTNSMSIAQLEALAQHLLVQSRAIRTIRSVKQAPVTVGDKVRVVGGDNSFVGLIGEVVVAGKLRVQVKVEERNKPLYLFRADVEAAQLDTDPGAG